MKYYTLHEILYEEDYIIAIAFTICTTSKLGTHTIERLNYLKERSCSVLTVILSFNLNTYQRRLNILASSQSRCQNGENGKDVKQLHVSVLRWVMWGGIKDIQYLIKSTRLHEVLRNQTHEPFTTLNVYLFIPKDKNLAINFISWLYKINIKYLSPLSPYKKYTVIFELL